MDERKPKLQVGGLISKLDDKGILFNEISKEEASDIIINKNYYYRISSYRKNFPKDDNNKYNIDFSVLTDLASIDTYLREFLLSLCLDVEHVAKTLLMTHITFNDDEDGYRIVRDYKNSHPNSYKRNIKHLSRNTYMRDMYIKRYGQDNEVPVWVFLEIIDFGSFSLLLDLYIEKYEIKKTKINKIQNIIMYIKNIRNACAHNNIFLLNIYNQSSNYIDNPTQLSNSIVKSIGVSAKNRFFNKTHDLLVLFWMHKKLCSDNLNARRHREGVTVQERIQKNKTYYNNSNHLNDFFTFFNKNIDFLLEKP